MQLGKVGNIAQRHRFPVPLTEDMLDVRDSAVLFRFDGERVAGRDQVYAVIQAADLAKVDIADAGISAETLDGSAGFFRETPAGVALYLAQSVYGDEIKALQANIADAGYQVLLAVGDLKEMGAPDNFRAPNVAAFEANDFPLVDIDAAFAEIESIRSEKNNETSLSADF